MLGELDDETLDVLTRIAWMYYKEGMTQAEIADRLGMTRAKVIRALNAAMDNGLIQIHLVHPRYNALKVERDVVAMFGLEDAMVVPTPRDPGKVRAAVAQAGALYLQRHLANGDIVGTAWGTTVYEVARWLSPLQLSNVSVAMILGGLTTVIEGLNPIDVVRIFAEKVNGRCFYLSVPAIVDSPEVKTVLMNDRLVRRAFEISRSATKVLVGIGDITDEAALIKTGFVDLTTMAELRAKGAVGDIVARYVDINGQRVDLELDERIVGLGLDDLRQMGTVIAAAGGPHKVEAIIGAIRSGCIDVLITDEATARAILAHPVVRRGMAG